MKRRVFSFLLVLVLTIACLPLSSVSAAQTSDGYIYTVTNGEATITDYTGIGGKLTIPSKLGGYPVTAIGTAAFSSYGSLTSVVIPEGVTSLGRTAFA